MPKSPNKVNPNWVVQSQQQKEKWQQEPFYNNRAWRNDSKRHLTANPLCVECLKKEIVKASEISDHIKPIKKGGEIWDWDNRQSLCRKCHYSKSAKDK